MKCPSLNCKDNINDDEVKQLVLPATYLKYEEFLLKRALDTMPDLRWCPKPKCGNAMIVGGGLMTRCTNPRCRFTFCINCKEEWHSEISCEQYQKWKEENSEEDSRYNVWVRQHSKLCPKCHAAIEKNGGCNHMTCKSCQHQFCWLCLADYTSNHYSTGPCNGKQFT
eukprot:TRINITY_DN1157_c0_g1_i6.p1 TRINITY_DN1157_c0_g1~~TRINITY_DN1157_c0_g1_i6.p1  ORF type:complete len:167 (-),score=40.98 TRINITY_DN1157_c0_g1_i6:62-562(-)